MTPDILLSTFLVIGLNIFPIFSSIRTVRFLNPRTGIEYWLYFFTIYFTIVTITVTICGICGLINIPAMVLINALFYFFIRYKIPDTVPDKKCYHGNNNAPDRGCRIAYILLGITSVIYVINNCALLPPGA